MTLATGSRLGVYEIVELVGLGGMGEVYRARDSRLDRDVAIKILPELFAGDPERVARFEREARTLASLSHPNIAAIHGVAEVDGVIALVLEYVGGPTLADWIRDHAANANRDFAAHLEDVVPVARQIIDALEAAHAAGIVHRDLKPANIKLSATGVVKVLDFGLAKAFEAQTVSASVSVSPTLASPAGATAFGTILGTAAYMSPEQARGKAVDKRADIWAFGCVLFEMLTGKRAFDGDDIADALASILRGEPDWKALDPRTPASIRRMLRRTLEKDPKHRLADIADARFELDAQASEAAVAAAPVIRIRRRWVRGFAEVAGALLIAVVSAYVAKTLASPPVFPVRRFVIVPSVQQPFVTASTGVNVAISPDGKTIVYTSQTSSQAVLMMRRIDELVARRINGTERGTAPFFSSDGTQIGFSVGNQLRRVPIAGGSPTKICEIPSAALITASWNTDGTIVFGDPSEPPGLFKVSVASGQRERITTAAKGEIHSLPQMLPGGKTLLYVAANGAERRTVARNLASGEEKVVLDDAAARYVKAGYLMYANRDSVLMAAPFDVDRLATTGPGVSVQDSVMLKGPFAVLNAAVADDGTLIVVPGSASGIDDKRHLMWAGKDGHFLPALPGNPILDYPRYPSLSRDGRRLLLTQGPSNAGTLWLFDLGGGAQPRKLTFQAHSITPKWMPDEKSVIFEADLKGKRSVYRMSLDGTNREPELLTVGSLESVSSDGAYVLFTGDDATTSRDLWVLPMTGDRKPTPWLQTPAYENGAEFSPNGQWVAYTSDETGVPEIWVRPFSGAGAPVRVSNAGGHDPVWSPTGKELFFTTDGPKLVVSPVLTNAPAFDTPRVVVDKDFVGWGVSSPRSFQVAPDGRLPVLQEEGGPAPATRSMVAILGWFDNARANVQH